MVCLPDPDSTCPIQVRVGPTIAQDQFFRAADAIGHKDDLSVTALKT
jgi:hypothetical protein